MSGKSVARRIRKTFNPSDPEVIAEKDGVDVKKGGTGIEIERSGSPRKISEAAARLKEAKKTGLVEKVKLKVPHKDLPEAAKAMKRRGLGGTVSNLGGTTKTRV